MSDNLTVYNAVRKPPKEAINEIQAGRLKGKSDINPMWRLKALTEQFGMCGIGWKYIITKQWLETGGKDEIAAFVNIDLFIKVDGAWSDAIPGTGGSSFVANERNGLYTSDECFKMALTDAISVACKALGVAADVYWNSDRSKYDKPQPEKPVTRPVEQNSKSSNEPVNFKGFWANVAKIGFTEEETYSIAGVDNIEDWPRDKVTELLGRLKLKKQEKNKQ